MIEFTLRVFFKAHTSPINVLVDTSMNTKLHSQSFLTLVNVSTRQWQSTYNVLCLKCILKTILVVLYFLNHLSSKNSQQSFLIVCKPRVSGAHQLEGVTPFSWHLTMWSRARFPGFPLLRGSVTLPPEHVML